MLAALLLGDDLAGVDVRDFGRERRRCRGGRDLDDVRFALRADADIGVDRFVGESPAKDVRGLRRHVTELDELQVGDPLTGLAAGEDERGRRGVLLGLLL